MNRSNNTVNIPVKISESLWNDPTFDKERFLTSRFAQCIARADGCTSFIITVEVVANEVA